MVASRQFILPAQPRLSVRRATGWPLANDGQKIGLLGGSFDPAHAGHVHITEQALKRFRLDQIWWLVSPGNPLKDTGPAPMHQRLAKARLYMRHPRVKITALEQNIGTRYTAQTLAALKIAYPSVRFTWLMGADNMAMFHKWENWEKIFYMVPIGIMARPNKKNTARANRAAAQFAACRLRGAQSKLLSSARAPKWCFVNIPMSSISSSQIRARGEWQS